MPIYNLQYTIYNRRNLAALILRTKNYELRTAFTLVELMIVVAILGILAAIVLREFQSQSQQAKEAAGKANLKILRDAIERYALDHNGVPPGYNNNDPSTTPNWVYIVLQLTENNKYLPEIPKNPFNNPNWGFNTKTQNKPTPTPEIRYGKKIIVRKSHFALNVFVVRATA